MVPDRSPGNAGKYLFRALCLRCPACGTKPVFVPWRKVRSLRDWFTPLDGCPRCGYAYEREPGYFLMSIWALNYGFGSLLGLLLYGLLEWFFDLPVWTLITAVVVPVLAFGVLFARHSKTLFLACDLFFDPHEKEGGDGGGGSKPAPPPGKTGSPVRSCDPAGTVQ